MTILSSVLTAAVLTAVPLLAQNKAALVEKLHESFYTDSSAADKMKALRSYLKRGGDINAVDEGGNSLLSVWLFAGLEEKEALKMLDFMIKEGININYQRSYPAGYEGDNLGQGSSVLMRACMGDEESSDVDGGGASPAIIKALLDAGADVHLKDESGYTALDFALWSGDVSVVKLLIEAGADVKAKGEDGRNALMDLAASYDPDPDMVAILLDQGLSINDRDGEGKTALAIFCESFNEYDGRLFFIEALMKAGADPMIKDAEGKTALDQLKAHLPDSKDVIERMSK